jgi:hypothetical protein
MTPTNDQIISALVSCAQTVLRMRLGYGMIYPNRDQIKDAVRTMRTTFESAQIKADDLDVLEAYDELCRRYELDEMNV